jgi:uncharacterized protein (DUF1015 family)
MSSGAGAATSAERTREVTVISTMPLRSSLRTRPVSLIAPFPALRPAPGRAPDVIAPPYDVLSSDEARVRAAGRPWSFLHVSKPEIDLPPETDVHAPVVYAKARENLDRMLREGVLVRDAAPALYVYRITSGLHVQTGLVAGASVAAYDGNRILRHELTRPDKEDDRVKQIEAVAAQTGPVLLAYPTAPAVDAMLAAVAAGAPDADATADDGVRHTLWRITSTETQRALCEAFDVMPSLYIADGHHRSAAASRVAAARRDAGCAADDPSQRFLVVAFPHHSLVILPYNRLVKDLNGRSAAAFLEAVSANFEVESSDTPVEPDRPATFGLYLTGKWFRLALRAGIEAETDPVERLDVSLLARYLLEPLLDIRDARRDPRIDFVGGARGVAELAKRVDSGEMAAAFSMYPTQLDDLMQVADADRIMPPKSTWFEPKLADGLVSLPLE